MRSCSGPRSSVLLAPVLFMLSLGNPVVDDFIHYLQAEHFTESFGGALVCHVGFSQHTMAISHQLLGKQAGAHVAFLHQANDMRDDVGELLQLFPGRAHAPETVTALGTPCSVLLLAMEDPRFTAEALHKAARGGMAIISYLVSECSGKQSYSCRYFHSAWNMLVGDSAFCSHQFCAAMVATSALEDPLLSSVDCAAMRSDVRPLSTASQWQQDWFVYQNFFHGTDLDSEHEAAQRPLRTGIFVDIGAFHPIHLSNTFFFDRCLGWKGLCAEPNPSWGPYFRAYRPNCKVVPNCVWNHPRSVVMSFEKDPIEAYIQGEVGADGAVGSGAVPIKGNSTRPQFAAECRTLEDILTAEGLQRPKTIDYMSVDAEAAEVEIFRNFPFEKFDISVVSVEVQAQHYYELDTIFLSAGYAKLAVLGGDHVFLRLQMPLELPLGAAEWHRKIVQNFHAQTTPRTDLVKNG